MRIIGRLLCRLGLHRWGIGGGAMHDYYVCRRANCYKHRHQGF